MPPKAKGKAKAKARVGPLHRPAGRVRRGVLRRPAGADEGGSPWDRGVVQEFHQVSLLDLQPGSWLVAEEADYFGAIIQFAGEVKRVELDQGERTLHVRATGTSSEALLKAQTSNPRQWFKCHVCPPGCARLTTGDFVVHLVKGRKTRAQGEEGWVTNLEGPAQEEAGDELDRLRQRALALQTGDGGRGQAPGDVGVGLPGQDANRESDKEKKKRKKEKKEKKKDRGVAEGRYPAVACQKALKEVYGGTGLDPRERVRKRVLKRAQRYISARKKAKSSSDSSKSCSSSSSPSVEETRGLEGVFTEETRIRAVAERYPGALALKRSLLTTSGEEVEEEGVRPVALLYFRSILSRRSSGAQSRELLNVSSALDLLVKGRVACAADLLAQRLKAQEAVCQGTSWAVAQRLELPPPEVGGLVATTELAQARKEEYNDARARWRAQSTAGGKGEPKGKGKTPKGEGAPWRREDRKEENKEKKGKGQDRKGG